MLLSLFMHLLHTAREINNYKYQIPISYCCNRLIIPDFMNWNVHGHIFYLHMEQNIVYAILLHVEIMGDMYC
jgi:hypothetical protein